ncbi:MAG: polysaccharide deacetylase family protein [Myxococcota bacterium]
MSLGPDDVSRRAFLRRSAAGMLPLVAGPTLLSGVARAAVEGPVTPASLGEWVGGIHWSDIVPDRIALTFDDGPRPGRTTRVMEVLDKQGITATFFVCGRLVRRFPEILRDLDAAGHQLANHTWSHPNLRHMRRREIEDQFERTADQVNEALEREVFLRYYRPPYGSPWYKKSKVALKQQQKISEIIDARGGLLCMWQVHSNDSHKGVTKASIYKSMRMKFDRKKAGAMVFHDSSKMTGRNLPEYLDFMRSYGLKFTTVDELVTHKYGVAPEIVSQLPTALRPARRS